MTSTADALEVLTVVAACHHRSAPRMDDEQATLATATVWAELFDRHDFSTADLIVAVKKRAQMLTEAPEPADIIRVARQARVDRLDRMDPDERAATAGDPQVRRDRYGHIDKSAPDEDPYPAEWTAERRLAETWDRIDEMRDLQEYEQARAHPGQLLPQPPASAETRAAVLAGFAARRGSHTAHSDPHAENGPESDSEARE